MSLVSSSVGASLSGKWCVMGEVDCVGCIDCVDRTD